MSIFNDDEDNNFELPENSDEKNERIRKFLQNLPNLDDNGYDLPKPRGRRRPEPKRKPTQIIAERGINTILSSLPKFKGSNMYYGTMDELFEFYTKDPIKKNEFTIENLNHMLTHFENEEEYEKCSILKKLTL
jgi:hypothetical protein